MRYYPIVLCMCITNQAYGQTRNSGIGISILMKLKNTIEKNMEFSLRVITLKFTNSLPYVLVRSPFVVNFKDDNSYINLIGHPCFSSLIIIITVYQSDTCMCMH